MEDRQFVTALARGLDVLRCFSPDRPELGTREIADLLELPQPTVWRLCHTLKVLGYLVPGSKSGRLRVGAPVLALGLASLVELEFTEIIRPHFESFISRFPAAVILAERHRLTMVYVLRCEGSGPFVMKRPVGSSISLHQTALGHACIAGMGEEERASVLEQVRAREPYEWPLIERRIEQAREQLQARGFVTSLGETEPAVSYAAVPIVPPGSGRAFAMLCGGPSFSLPADVFHGEIGPQLVSLAKVVRAAFPSSR
jgi:DNA-binding IclR family transcriptional regulator